MRRRAEEKMKINIKKITALALSINMILQPLSIVVYADTQNAQAVNPEQDIIYIDSATALKEISKNATTEEFTLGKSYALSSDIDLSNEDFTPIPVFSGILDGQGHTIKGLSISEKSSDAGLIGLIGEQGVVKNLNIEGNIAPGGSKITAGGVVGTNKGIIDSVNFSGILKAYKTVGGMAGINDDTGFILNSKNYAQVDGTKLVGGIAGINKGVIISCENKGRIFGSKEVVLSDENTAALPKLNVETVTADEEKPEIMGGIAGVSTGYIKSCSNLAKVGYEHTSYKVGGIAGVQNGVIEECSNQAIVYGRRDVGGIVGVLEPYMEIAYESDTLDKLNRQLEVLNKLSDDFSAQIDSSVSLLQEDSDNISAKQDNLKQNFDNRIDIHKQENDKFNEGLDEKRKNLEGVGENIADSASDAADKIGDLRDRPSYSDIIKSDNTKLENTIAAIKNISTITERMKSSLENKRGKLDGIEQDFSYLSGDIDELYNQSKDLIDYLDNQKDQFSDDLSDSRNIIKSDGEALKAEIDKAKEDLRTSSQSMKTDIDNIRSEIGNIRGIIDEGEDNLRAKIEDKTVFYDISAKSDKNFEKAKLINSVNKAEVIGDFNVAGIVGRIGIDLKETISDNIGLSNRINKSGETSLNFSDNIYAIVSGNTNDADINANNDYVGGIVAKADYGAITGNQNYGNISSENGSYAGGIAGYSTNVLSDSYSLSSVSAVNYVGGIAGSAKELKNNTVMSEVVSTEDAKKGSIAGELTEEGNAEYNRYVDYGVGAINNISFAKEANTVSYEELLSQESTPERFKYLEVKYVVGDDIIKTVKVDYGDSISSANIPQPPKKDGYNTYWEATPGREITTNTTIHLISALWNKDIVSVESVGEKPVLLANSYFYNGTTVEVKEAELSGDDKNFSKKVLKKYEYNIIPGSNGSYIELRVLSEDKNADVIAIKTEDGIKIVESERIGSYISFRVDRSKGEFLILKNSGESNMKVLIAIGITAILVLGCGLYLRKKK
jgi:hypothetical protein